MTPQELMDMPGYGSAEKELRRSGQWRLTKEEITQDVLDTLKETHYSLEGAMYKLETQR